MTTTNTAKIELFIGLAIDGSTHAWVHIQMLIREDGSDIQANKDVHRFLLGSAVWFFRK